MQLFCPGRDNMVYNPFPQTAPTDDAEKIISKPHSPHTIETAPTQQKEKT